MSENVYQLECRAVCPHHKELTDVYAVTIRTNATIPVETILATVKKFEKVQMFQEELTLKIATALGVRVETVGVHSGVTVRSVAP